LSASVGTPVQSVEDGRVIFSQNNERYPYSTATTPPLPLSGAGNRVVVRHSDGTTSNYYHLDGNRQPAVGESVVAGQVIGNVGRSGNVPLGADPHLHFELRNRAGQPVEPVIAPSSSSPRSRLYYDENAPRGGSTPAVAPRQAGQSAATASLRF
jgi:murein DD-endopeptidase MepM/ murein hydrolase activator NlpD